MSFKLKRLKNRFIINMQNSLLYFAMWRHRTPDNFVPEIKPELKEELGGVKKEIRKLFDKYNNIYY